MIHNIFVQCSEHSHTKVLSHCCSSKAGQKK